MDVKHTTIFEVLAMTIYDNNSKKITRTITKYVYDGKAFDRENGVLTDITLISEAKYLTEATATTVEEKRAYNKALANFSNDRFVVVRLDLNSVNSGLYETTVAEFLTFAKFVKTVTETADETADETTEEAPDANDGKEV